MSQSNSNSPSGEKASDTELESKRKQRQGVEQKLARAPACSEGFVHVPASGTTNRAAAGKAQRLAYTVSAAFIPVLAPAFEEDAGEPQAAVFTIAYLLNPAAAALKGASPAPKRPVCFAFNGGPGSASIWLHLGALGPKRVRVNDDGSMPTPPFTVEDNPHTWLEHFDLVFIDPPHTGWSTTASKQAREKMLSVDGDVDALAEVMRAWLARHQRFDCPVYLAGESYGTTRGAALADKMQDLGVALSGVILVSCAMDLQTIVFNPGNDLPYGLFLPGFAGVAQYHGKLTGALAKSPEAARAAAEAFVQEDYLRALHQGGALQGAARTRIAKRVAELSGLPQALVEQRNLRIRDEDFFPNLLLDRGQKVGRLEARVAGPHGARHSQAFEFDPGIESIAAPYTMACAAYFAQELGLASEERYEVLSLKANEEWNWNRGKDKGNSYACTSPDLARAMRRNAHLRVFVASGHYDLGTPSSASNYSLAQLDLQPAQMQRITHCYYDAGHMMYTREADLVKLKRDLAQWLAP